MTVLETSSQRSSAELTDEPRRPNENTIAVQTIVYICIQYIGDCLRAQIATANYDDYRYHGRTRMMTMVMMMTTMTATMTMQMKMTMTMTMTTRMVMMMMMLMMTTIVHFDDDDGDGDGRSHVRDNAHHSICSFSEHRACTTITQVLVR